MQGAQHQGAGVLTTISIADGALLVFGASDRLFFFVDGRIACGELAVVLLLARCTTLPMKMHATSVRADIVFASNAQ